ncbi:hypothetical protein HOD20_09070 [archaeon]|jgi:hypothetical protein|nr:hypothetical protein [archaeon]MBT4352661.1 hypothetical protein [archaeon]MBT4647905.1 hypothetical protein [archaeon]MBT7393139.1 hypothetical protein [archaeon]
MVEKNKFISLWLIIGIVVGFLAILFFSLLYLNNNVLCSLDCRSRNEILIVIVLLSLVGMFVGSLTYYFISEKYEKKITKIHKNLIDTLQFLDLDQRTIFKKIISNKGIVTQSKLVLMTKWSRVKISRILKILESKKIIEKSKKGLTNNIKLNDNLKKLFLEK